MKFRIMIAIPMLQFITLIAKKHLSITLIPKIMSVYLTDWLEETTVIPASGERKLQNVQL